MCAEVLRQRLELRMKAGRAETAADGGRGSDGEGERSISGQARGFKLALKPSSSHPSRDPHKL